MHPAKTSKSQPLRVDSVGAGLLGGLIGMTFCPGKKQKDAQSGTWDRDLDADLKAIKDFGGPALVTLMSDSELRLVSVPPDQLQDKTSNLGMEWYQLPIPDAGIPDQTFEVAWRETGNRLRASFSKLDVIL
jgi:ADP-ribosyl-[dinitrogen reductase] hydrolase